MKCPLCFFESAPPLIPGFRHCPACDLRFKEPQQFLEPAEEQARYESHNNDVNDERYRLFNEPLYKAIREFQREPGIGLDFGCGRGPIVTKELRENGFSVNLYDPFFYPDRSVLERTYDFVFASEVIEHFFHPQKEFTALRTLLKPGGFLAVMTAIYDESIDFPSWYYHRDPTHTVFYSRRTLEFIALEFGFNGVHFRGERVAVLSLAE